MADGLPTLVVTHQLQLERRTGKVRRPETDVLPLCHATNCAVLTGTERLDVSRGRRVATGSAVERRPAAAAVGDHSHRRQSRHRSTRTNAPRTVKYTIERTK